MYVIDFPKSRFVSRFRAARLVVMFGVIAAAAFQPPDIAGGDGFRMASAVPRTVHCLVGGGGEMRGQAACVRTVAAGFTPFGEPAAGVLFATLALAPAHLRRRRRPVMQTATRSRAMRGS